MSELEFQREMSRMTVRAGVIVLCVLGVCALVAFLLWLYEQHRKETNRHAEAEMAIMASQDLGQTAWAHTSVYKDKLIREQAAKIGELNGWIARTKKRMAALHLSDVLPEA